MKLVAFHKLGENRNSPRLWLESRRLNGLGFSAGTAFTVQEIRNGVRLTPASDGTHHVSQRRAAGRTRPIIDLANRIILQSLAGWAEVRVDASHQIIEVKPSVRAFSIRDRLRAVPPFRTLEVFCGGGTLSAAIAMHRGFRLVAGIEMEAKFADVWQAAHPAATLFQADMRRIIHRNIPRTMCLWQLFRARAIRCWVGPKNRSPVGRNWATAVTFSFALPNWWRAICRSLASSRTCRLSQLPSPV
jgi:hypothetical protein